MVNSMCFAVLLSMVMVLVIFFEEFLVVFPVILRGATGFVNAASKASDEGASPLEAAKAGLRPGAAGLVSGAVNALQKYQSGSGRKRKHRRVYKEVKRAKLSHSNLPQIKYNF